MRKELTQHRQLSFRGGWKKKVGCSDFDGSCTYSRQQHIYLLYQLKMHQNFTSPSPLLVSPAMFHNSLSGVLLSVNSPHTCITFQQGGGILAIYFSNIIHFQTLKKKKNPQTYYVFFFICDCLHVMSHEDNGQNQVNNSKKCVQPKKIVTVGQNVMNVRNRNN